MEIFSRKNGEHWVVETIVEPPSRFYFPDCSEAWRARSLAYALVLSEIRSRNRQTFVGFSWNVISPVLAMLVYSLLFGHLGSFGSDGLPYPLFFFSAYIIWQYFMKALSQSVPSLASNAALMSKVYFPRLIVLIVPILTATVDLGFYSVGVALLYLYYGMFPPIAIVIFPLLVALTGFAALAIASWLAPLNVYVRDVQVVLPALLQLGLFVTPIVYSPQSISESWRWLVYLNPMAIIVEASRWALAGGAPPSWLALLASTAVVFIVLFAGLFFFQRTALTMVDRL